MLRLFNLMTLSTLSVICAWSFEPLLNQKLDEASIRLLDRELQKVFGVEADVRMARSRRHVSTPKPVVPQFMIDLANQDRTRHSTVQNDDFTFNGNLRSYHPKYFDTSDDSSASTTDHEHRHLQFDVPNLPPNEILASAELKIFAESQEENTEVVIKIFNVRPNPNNEFKFDFDAPCPVITDKSRHPDEILDLIDSKVIKPTDHSQWHSFNITSLVSDWLKSDSLNCGLHVSITSLPITDEQPKTLSKSQVKLKLTEKEQTSNDDWLKDYEPLLIVKSHDPERTNRTQKRSTEVGTENRKHEKTSDSVKRARRAVGASSTPNSRSDKSKRLESFQNQLCNRYLFHIDFNQIHWVDWVLAPPGFAAYICVGSCPFPLAHHVNSTNHAIVQTVVNSFRPHVVGSSCCVPTELSSISLLFLDHNNTPVLRAYKDMVVEGCGCR